MKKISFTNKKGKHLIEKSQSEFGRKDIMPYNDNITIHDFIKISYYDNNVIFKNNVFLNTVVIHLMNLFIGGSDKILVF